MSKFKYRYQKLHSLEHKRNFSFSPLLSSSVLGQECSLFGNCFIVSNFQFWRTSTTSLVWFVWEVMHTYQLHSPCFFFNFMRLFEVVVFDNNRICSTHVGKLLLPYYPVALEIEDLNETESSDLNFCFCVHSCSCTTSDKKEREKRDDINNLIGTSCFKGYFHYTGFIIIYS